MEWFHSKKHDAKERADNAVASRTEIEAVFEDERENLFWIALLITGDAVAATKSIVNATQLTMNGSGVFRDWLVHWARSATARVASETVQTLISASANSHADVPCDHSDHEVLSDEGIRSLYQVNPEEIAGALDPLSRSVLVLRGVQHASISDCSLLLRLPRRSVISAYCRALRWNDEREHACAASEHSLVSGVRST